MADPTTPSDGKTPGKPKPRRIVPTGKFIRSQKIGCSSCAAPLEISHPEAAQQLSCSYCGAVLDLAAPDRAVLRKLVFQNRPDAALKVGMVGHFRSAEWRICGRLRVRNDPGYAWDEYLLFSPTKGYAWLEHDEGRWTFETKLQEKPDFDAKNARPGQRLQHQGMIYVVEEREKARLEWVEGEFPYHAQVGDRVENVDMRQKSATATTGTTLAASWSGVEFEWFAGTRLSRNTIEYAFGLAVKRSDRPAATSSDRTTAIVVCIVLGLIGLLVIYSAYEEEFGSGGGFLRMGGTHSRSFSGFGK